MTTPTLGIYVGTLATTRDDPNQFEPALNGWVKRTNGEWTFCGIIYPWTVNPCFFGEGNNHFVLGKFQLEGGGNTKLIPQSSCLPISPRNFVDITRELGEGWDGSAIPAEKAAACFQKYLPDFRAKTNP